MTGAAQAPVTLAQRSWRHNAIIEHKRRDS